MGQRISRNQADFYKELTICVNVNRTLMIFNTAGVCRIKRTAAVDSGFLYSEKRGPTSEFYKEQIRNLKIA